MSLFGVLLAVFWRALMASRSGLSFMRTTFSLTKTRSRASKESITAFSPKQGTSNRRDEIAA